MVATDPQAQDRVGSVLHEKWTLERLIGVGGMGAVYAARHRNGARAAVKVLSPAMGRLPHIRKRFLHEGYAANRVDHAGAVKVLDDDVIPEGEDEGTAYLVMELLEGETLGDRAKREPPLGERELLEIADGVLAVLAAAHANGVVHRDLKPDNLFLARDAEREGTQIKVLDFGLARLLEAREQTIAGMAIGTPTYMSPEQAAGHVDEIDGRTDIYALGSILFQLASNKRIHDAAHTLGLVVRMATTPAPKLRSVAPDVSEPFARIVDRALEFKREDRYLTAAAMRADVQAALELLPAGASTLNVISPPTPASARPVVPLPAPHVTVPQAPALADTVRVPAVVAAAVAPSLGRALAPPDEEVVVERASLSSRPQGATRAPRSWFPTAILLAVAGMTGYLLWTNRSPIHRVFVARELDPTPVEIASGSLESPTPGEAAVDASALETPLGDASSLVVELGDLDASTAEETDDPADASAGDDEEDDDEEEEAEELDASIEASAPTLPSPPIAVGASRPAPRSPVAKPAPKKRPPVRASSQPAPKKKKKKKRWHW